MNNIAVPKNMQHLATDHRGYPITFTVFTTSEGIPDFTTTNPLRWRKALIHRLCGMCGKVLRQKVWFVGGPLCIHNRLFWDHPMHEECARYSLQVCPYLSMPKYLGAKSRPTPDDMRVPITSSNSTKPERFGLASTNHYKLVTFQGDPLLFADVWRSLEWWKDAKLIETVNL